MRMTKAAWAESKRRIDVEHARTRAVVTANACPCCGRPVKRNNAIAGWWQCVQFGAVGFRKDPEQPSCDWQGFTE